MFAWLAFLLGCHEVTIEELGAAACSDGLDNDGDGLRDCRDADCQGPPACPKRFVTCKGPDASPPAPTFGVSDDRACSVEQGKLYCWGASYTGSDDHARPERIGTKEDWLSVAVGPTHACAIDGSLTLHCWGRNDAGQLGTGDGARHDAPTPVASTERFASVAVGDAHTCALSQAREVYCWGSNVQGQLGLGDTEARSLPEPVEPGRAFRQVVAGPQRTCAIDDQAVLFCWGALPTPRAATSRPAVTFWNLCAAQVSTGGDFTCGVDENEIAYCWGGNDQQQLGFALAKGEALEDSYYEVPYLFGSLVTAGAAHACLLDMKQSFTCWGDASQGQRASSADDAYSTVKGAYVEVRAGGATTCARLGDGSLSCTGDNTHGQCGSRELPSMVTTLTRVDFR